MKEFFEVVHWLHRASEAAQCLQRSLELLGSSAKERLVTESLFDGHEGHAWTCHLQDVYVIIDKY